MKYLGTLSTIYEKLNSLLDTEVYEIELKIVISGTIRGLYEKLENLKKELFKIDIRPKKKKRSLDQNNYYWELNDQFANELRMSKMELHHRTIANFGQRLILEGEPAVIKLPITYDYAKEEEGIYFRPTDKVVVNDGKERRWHFIMRGSSTYNTKEMSILIDGLIQEIKDSGSDIETLTPKQMVEMWGAWEV